MKKENQSAKKPFFAHFLEDQNLSGDNTDTIQGGATLKYPSDQEESTTSRTADVIGGGYVTLKVPSDSDEAGGLL